MTETLAEKKCTPCRGGIAPLTHEEAERFRSQTPNWELRDDGHRIERTSALAIFAKHLALLQTSVTWLKPKAITPISASAGATRPSRCEPRKSRDCTRTILSWQARSIGYSLAQMTLPIVSEIGTPAPWRRLTPVTVAARTGRKAQNGASNTLWRLARDHSFRPRPARDGRWREDRKIGVAASEAIKADLAIPDGGKLTAKEIWWRTMLGGRLKASTIPTRAPDLSAGMRL